MKIQIIPNIMEGKLSAEIQCTDLTYISLDDLQAQVLDTDQIHTFGCVMSPDPSSQSLTFDGNIDCNKEYNITVRWTAPNEIAFGERECTLGDVTAQELPCKGSSINSKYMYL